MSTSDLQQALQAELPSCAFTCFAQVLESVCGGFDQACICTNETFVARVNPCLLQNCTITNTLATQNVTSTTCGISPQVDYDYVPPLIVFIILALISFLLRTTARVITGVKWWWDDYTISIAMLGTVGVTITTLLSKRWDLGVDIWAVSPENITRVLLSITYITGVLYTINRHLIRVSILMFYLRIFTATLARKLSIVTLVLIVSDGIAFTVMTIFQCTPISFSWEQWDGEHAGKCVDLIRVLWANVSLGVLWDVWMVSFPIYFVSRLQLTWKKRLEVSLMFTFGIATTALNLARIPAIRASISSTNPTRANVPTVLLSALENDVGIICACLPSIHGLAKYLFAGKTVSQIQPTYGSAPDTHIGTGRTGRQPLVYRSAGTESAGSHTSVPHIEMTTTIEQHQGWGSSDTEIPLSDLNVVDGKHGVVKARVWA